MAVVAGRRRTSLGRGRGGGDARSSRKGGVVEQSKPWGAGLLSIAATLALLYVFRAVLWPLALALVLSILIGVVTQRGQKLLPRAGAGPSPSSQPCSWAAWCLASCWSWRRVSREVLSQAGAIYRRLDETLGAVVLPGVGRLTLDGLVGQIGGGQAIGLVAGGLQAASAGLSLTALYLVFIVAGARSLEARLTKIFTTRRSDTLVTVLKRSIQGVEAYTYIQTVTGLMIAVAAFAIMFAVGLKSALFWALTLFLLSYLPVVGVAVGSVGPTLFALVQFPTPAPALAILGGIQAIAFVVGNLVLPKMQADSQNIDPAASLLAIGVWTILWGIPGAFLAIPLTLVLMYALAQYRSVEWIAVLLSNDGSPLPPAPVEDLAAS